MAVDTFPVSLPLSLNGQLISVDAFDPVRVQAAGSTGGVRDFTIDRGQPRWLAKFKTRPLTAPELGAMEAFKAKLRGRARYCLIYDPRHAYPAAYMPAGWGTLTRAGGGSFDGTCHVASIANSGLDGVGRDVVTLGASGGFLPVGLSLIAGDHVSFSQSGLVSLHRILDTAAQVANGSGVVTVWVEPELPASLTTSAVADLQQAQGKFAITKLELPADAKGRFRPGSASFEAISTYN